MVRKKKPAMTSDELLAMMHPDLPTSDDLEPKQETRQAPSAEEQIAALTQQVSQLTQQLTTSARPSASTVVEKHQERQAPQAPVINYAAMPDPIRDPVGYTQFLQSTVNAQVQYEKDLYNFQQEEANRSRSRSDTIWNEFANNYGAYAENEKRIEIATTQVLKRVADGGGDVDAFMANRAGFFGAITSEYDDLFGKPQVEDDDDLDDVDDDGDDNRAQVFGGSAAGPKGPSEPAKAPPQKYGALGSEIRSWQEKTGFYR